MTNFRWCHFDFHRDLHHDDMMILSLHLYSRINGTEMKAAPGEAVCSLHQFTSRFSDHWSFIPTNKKRLQYSNIKLLIVYTSMRKLDTLLKESLLMGWLDLKPRRTLQLLVWIQDNNSGLILKIWRMKMPMFQIPERFLHINDWHVLVAHALLLCCLLLHLLAPFCSHLVFCGALSWWALNPSYKLRNKMSLVMMLGVQCSASYLLTLKAKKLSLQTFFCII